MNRVVRSTSVPIAELPSPRIRSPSQCPGTARSSASAGRSLIMTSSVTKSLPRRARARGTRSARPGAQARGQLAPERATALHIQRLVDRLVRDTHRLIIGEVERAAGRRSAPGSTTSPSAGPCAGRDADRSTERPDRPPHRRQAAPQPRTDDPAHTAQLARSRPAWPASDAARAGPHATAPWSPDTRDRRRESRRCDAARARSSTASGRAAGRSPAPRSPLGAQQRDLLPLGERQVAPRQRRLELTDGIPPPSRNHRTPTTGDTPASTPAASLVAPRGDRRPEPLPMLPAPAGGRPGDRITGRPVRSDPQPFGLPIATPLDRALRRPLESALAALIGVMNRARVWATSGERHLERVDDQLGAEMVGHRPADDQPGEQVLDVREVQEPLPRRDVGDVRRPGLVRARRAKVALDAGPERP